MQRVIVHHKTENTIAAEVYLILYSSEIGRL